MPILQIQISVCQTKKKKGKNNFIFCSTTFASSFSAPVAMSTRFLPVIATVSVASVSVPGTSIANPLAGSFATWRRRRSGGRFFASPIAFSARNGGRGRFDGSLHRRETLGQFSIDLNLKKTFIQLCNTNNRNLCWIYLNWDGDSGEKTVVPVQLCEQLADHRPNRHRMTSARFRINFLKKK